MKHLVRSSVAITLLNIVHKKNFKLLNKITQLCTTFQNALYGFLINLLLVFALGLSQNVFSSGSGFLFLFEECSSSY